MSRRWKIRDIQWRCLSLRTAEPLRFPPLHAIILFMPEMYANKHSVLAELMWCVLVSHQSDSSIYTCNETRPLVPPPNHSPPLLILRLSCNTLAAFQITSLPPNKRLSPQRAALPSVQRPLRFRQNSENKRAPPPHVTLLIPSVTR